MVELVEERSWLRTSRKPESHINNFNGGLTFKDDLSTCVIAKILNFLDILIFFITKI